MKIKKDYKLKDLLKLGFRKFDHCYFYTNLIPCEILSVNCETRKIRIQTPRIVDNMGVVEDLLFVIAKLSEMGIIEYE